MTPTIIDISFWQTPLQIDYDLLANHIDGAIIRAAYGTGEDTKFDQHYQELNARGVPCGAYHYIIGSQSMSKQASAFNQITAGKELKLGRWMDVEDTRLLTKLNRAKVLEYAALMPDMGIYTSRSKWQAIMGAGSYLTDRKMWVAHYKVGGEPALPQGWNSYTFWQWSSTGRLAGYSGNLDLNDFGGSEDEWNAWVGDSEPEPPVEEKPLYKAKVITTPPNRLKTRYTANGAERPKADWLPSGAIVDVYQETTGWARISVGRWVSTTWIQRVPDEGQIADGLLDVQLWSQQDIRWGGDRMGSSYITLKQEGCLVTAVSSYLDYLGIDTDPKRYNQLLSTRGGYQPPNKMYWLMPDVLWKGQVARAEYQGFSYGQGWETLAQSILDSGRPALAHVDFIPGGSVQQHWVLLIGNIDGVWWMYDPIDGSVSALAARYDKIYRIVGYRRTN